MAVIFTFALLSTTMFGLSLIHIYRIIEILPDRVIDRKETYDEYLASLAEEDLKKLR